MRIKKTAAPKINGASHFIPRESKLYAAISAPKARESNRQKLKEYVALSDNPTAKKQSLVSNASRTKYVDAFFIDWKYKNNNGNIR